MDMEESDQVTDKPISPGVIRKLDEVVINRIAAGEVVQRPANALKELLENSLDAGANNIQVVVKAGGLKLLQIQDDGCGIKKESLTIVCERFTTSKLETFEDLQQISTYGFRGEALASISHVSHLTIVTKTESSQCAYRAEYTDGGLTATDPNIRKNKDFKRKSWHISFKIHLTSFAHPEQASKTQCWFQKLSNMPRSPLEILCTNIFSTETVLVIYSYLQLANPRACAGKQGTMIIAEDLFFNMETRRRALKATSEEHNKIVDVVTRYAIHNPSVGFSVKKQGEMINDLRTPPKSSTLDNIRILYGVQIARELVPVSCEDGAAQFSMNGYISNVNYSVKKPTFLLFINNRLVESSALRRGIDSVYSSYLPKGSHPYIYISLHIEPRNVDVNVHPTKYEVHFLHEDMITSAVANAIEKVLLGSNQSRTFFVQTLLPGAPGPSTSTASEINRKRKVQSLPTPEDKTTTNNNNLVPPALHAKNMVRTDPRLQKLDKYLTSSTPNTSSSTLVGFHNTPSRVDISEVNMSKEPEILDDSFVSTSPSGSKGSITSTSKKREIRLRSVRNLREKIESDCHNGLLDVFRNFTFVGCIDRTLGLIQHDTKLHVVNNFRISAELFYQKMVYEFGNFGRINIEEPIFIHELAGAALEANDSGFSEGIENKNETALEIQEILLKRATMLDDYFALKFDENGRLLSIPLLLEHYFPSMEGIPQYLVDVARKVDWTDEQKCFETFCHQTALFYAIQTGDDGLNEETCLNGKTWKWTIEHVLYPEVKKSFLPPKVFAEDSTILQVADLPKLYKVFERC